MVYLLEWDSKGMLLKRCIKQSTLTGGYIPIRNKVSMSLKPVFWEELYLLGFDQYWNIPKSDNPLLWYNVKSRCYYHNGRIVAKHSGGNVKTPPKVEVYEEDLKLDKNSILKDVKRNKDLLIELEEEAINFIKEVSKNYNDIVVSFSGGKDSLAVLYLTLKALEDVDKNLQVLYVNTTLESKYTLELVEKIKKWVEDKGVKFNIIYPKRDAYELMAEKGIPTRLNRWCCKYLKLYPIERFYYKLTGLKRVLSLEGLRKEESLRRSKYGRVEVDKVIKGEVKAHPILDWASLEVWLYLFLRELPINRLYRYGLYRVGCIFCPFHQGWTEYILKNVEDTGRYWELLERQVKYVGVKDVPEYILSGKWKARYSFNKEDFKRLLETLEEVYREVCKDGEAKVLEFE